MAKVLGGVSLSSFSSSSHIVGFTHTLRVSLPTLHSNPLWTLFYYHHHNDIRSLILSKSTTSNIHQHFEKTPKTQPKVPQKPLLPLQLKLQCLLQTFTPFHHYFPTQPQNPFKPNSVPPFIRFNPWQPSRRPWEFCEFSHTH